jgi:hypothetical protein
MAFLPILLITKRKKIFIILTTEEPVILDDPRIAAVAEKYGKTPAQVLLRWQVSVLQKVMPTGGLRRLKPRIGESSIFNFKIKLV